MMKVAFYKATRPGLQGLFNSLVRWWTNGPYSHCEVVITALPEGKFLCASSSFIDGGVRFKDIDLKSGHWDLFEIDACEVMAAGWFGNNTGRKYDVLGLLGFVWRRADGHKKKYFSSEAVAAAIGLQDAWRYDPNALAAVMKSINKFKGGSTCTIT